MAENASRKQVGKPIAPGEVRNPKGVNQWTALRERASDLFTKEAQKRIQRGDEATVTKLEAWLDHVWDKAIAGDAPHLDKLIAERILPAVQQIEVSDKRDREPPKLPATKDRLTQVAEVLEEVRVLRKEGDSDALH